MLPIISALLSATMFLSACAAQTPPAPESSAPATTQSEESAKAEESKTTEKTKVKFYGLINEYPPVAGMIDRMKEKLPQYDIEVIPVDWGNLETVIKTGIASGDPADVYCYWPQAMTDYVAQGQAYDLTAALEADGGKWKNEFVPAALNTGLYDGKYFAVPLDSTYQMAMVNKEAFEKAGVTINETWTWDEFMSACEKLKTAGYHPFGLWRDGQDWFVKNNLGTILKSENKYEQWLNFEIPGSDPALSKVLDRAKELDEKGYWYPGEGGVNSARDEAKASFLSGQTAILFEMASLYDGISKEAGFEVVPVCWPKEKDQTVCIGGTDGFFIPANAKNPEAAVECLKVLLDAESQASLPTAGIIPSNAAVKIDTPSIQKLAELSKYMEHRTIPGNELGTFLRQVFVADYVLGTRSKDDILKEYDQLIKDTKENN